MARATTFPEFWTQAQIAQYESTIASLEAQGKPIPDPWWVSSPSWSDPSTYTKLVMPEEITTPGPTVDPMIIAEGIKEGIYDPVAPEEVKLELKEAGIGTVLGWLGGIASTALFGSEVTAAVQEGITVIGGLKKEISGPGKGGIDMTTGIITGDVTVDMIPFSGPGVPEPPASMVAKMWKTKSFSNTAGEYWVYHWILIDGRRATYNAAKKQVKVWRPKKNIVLGPQPRVKDLIKANRAVNRVNTRLKKQLRKAKVEL